MAKKTINGLPVFEARMTSENCGVLRVSLVDDPAVESDFIAYAEQERKALYEITDEDKQRVFGCVLRADYPIYRRDDQNGEYYIVFKADEIRAFAQKYLKDGLQNEVDLEHDFKSIDGAEMVQYFLKDSEKGISPAGYEDIADGSLFAEYQITDADLWQRIKEGEFHGFSVEIIHAVLPSEYNQIKRNMRKSVLAKVKDILAKAVSDMEAEVEGDYKVIATDKGAVVWEGDEDIAEGMMVRGEDEDGDQTVLEDGDYKTNDNRIIVVKDGKVAEIKDAPVEEEKEKGGEEKPAEGEDSLGKKKPEQSEFSKKCETYSASYDEKRRAIFDAIVAKLPALYLFYIYDCGDDFAVIEVEDAACNYHFIRYGIAWEGKKAVVVGDGVEGHIGFIPDVEEAPAEPSEDEMASVKSDYEAQITAKDAEIADLKAKLEAPAGQSAHDAYKGTRKGTYAGTNPIEEAMAFLK